MGWGTLSNQGNHGSFLVCQVLLKKGSERGDAVTPKSAVSLAAIYPPPADLGCLLGQGQEVTVEEIW